MKKNKFLHVLLFLSVCILHKLIMKIKQKFILLTMKLKILLILQTIFFVLFQRLKLEEFIDKGPYKAQIYERCDVAGARADAQAAASGGQQQQGAPEIEVASTMIVDVKFLPSVK